MEDCLKQKNLLRFDLWFIKTITLSNLSTFTFSTSDCLISPIYNEFKFIKDIIAIANRDNQRVLNVNNGSNMEKVLKAIDKL